MLDRIRIVLVQTFHPGNIGASARAMKTMGLSDLVLVNPRQFPDEEATRLAAGATDVIDGCRVVESLSDAIADCVQVIGASARLRSLPLPCYHGVEPMIEASWPRLADGPVAMVFGRERYGLTNEEIGHCTHQLNIPANPDYGILNLSQAVQIVAYEAFKRHTREASDAASRTSRAGEAYPNIEQLAHFHDHLHRALTSAGFLNQPHAKTEAHLKALFARAEPSRKELSILRGVLNALERSDPT
ncbi:RNA methyltransferase [Salinicola rhizosphaerae]|uniref:tRNA (cytidine/uridine-2'-O-)-methyltransferase TrmJ n=1 Tax=Salinicola rhizosphaerae TaxID=1443141 RepID=A0ABQ3EDC2_9GAMM|nr:RNA methyltransferase [Salinicola rhizosphaerae]GHB27270.1 tRNA (cytidine/uridine-2'-O-)-methyltransferase TrmJ [Salinicola rhizosphaerae]